eukprot:TRINITY_DN1490_c0_g1_i1.p1 TRINITY_DN1490_c0_g1~~TRINITY_DN1490_c0_g1_i1.p1  ORF type:complete len:410 (-),score=105.00 TRINITY_DN1490_c0_g1_i1:872-2101(-)
MSEDAWSFDDLKTALDDGKGIDENVTQLDLEGNILEDEIIQPLCLALSNNKSLTWINFKYCELKFHTFPPIFQALSKHPTLTHLKLNGSYSLKAKQLEDLLVTNTGLTKLNLNGCDLRDEGLEDLFKVLEHNTTLKEINLSSNNIATEKSGSKALSEILKLNHLKKINLKLNHFHQYDKKSIKILSEGLQQNTSLTDLNLEGNYIESVGYQWLAAGLKAHPALTKLNLSGSDITGGAKWLNELLTQNRVLKTLYLNYAEMNEEACRVLALHFTHLDVVKLESNTLTAKEVQWLVQGLTSNSHLRELSLMRNTIGSEGCRALCTALKTNTTLQFLDLRFNGIAADVSGEVRDMLRVNKGLRTLFVSSNALDTRVMMEALAENSVLREFDTDELHDEVAELLDKNRPEDEE